MSADEEKKKKDEAKEKKTARKRQTKVAKSQKAKKPAKRSRAKKATAKANGGDTNKQTKRAEEVTVPVSASPQEPEQAKAPKAAKPESSNGNKAAEPQRPVSPMQGDAKIEEVVKFTLARQLYGLPTRQVVEVQRMVAFTVLPVQPRGMLGVVNFRGEVIPLVDLRQVIDLPSQYVTLSTPILIARTRNRLFGLVVDEVLEVESVPLGSQTQVDEISTDVHYVAAVARVDEGLLLIVNLEEVQQAMPNIALETVSA
jgi:purine-binding chemotaxis protein CheW